MLEKIITFLRNLFSENDVHPEIDIVSDLVYNLTKKAILSDKSKLRLNNGFGWICLGGNKIIILGEYSVYPEGIVYDQSPSFRLTSERMRELNDLFKSEYKLREEKSLIKSISDMSDYL